MAVLPGVEDVLHLLLLILLCSPTIQTLSGYWLSTCKQEKLSQACPVLDNLPDGYQVSVENSAIVYDNHEGTVSTIVCNWFGAGNAALSDPNNDSSIQSYSNIYDKNWITKGNSMIAPGIERVDTIKTDSGYEMKSIWTRNDLIDTSIMKLSTSTGYIYGYVQDLKSGMWQYIILDFETGKTVFTMDGFR